MVHLPSALVGPGSQPEEADGAVLDYMIMPSGMRSFSAPHLPEAEDVTDRAAGKAAAEALLVLLRRAADGGEGGRVMLTDLAPADAGFVRELLGQGEVSVIGGDALQAQESVLAGVWHVIETAPDGGILAEYAEVGDFPAAARALAFAGAAGQLAMPADPGANIFNAPPLVAEINEALRLRDAGARAPHIINLSLLPHTPEDLTFLDALLGTGPLIILSRGYGNCRIRATRTRDTWWVRFYNSQDTLILNSIEVGDIPEAALASAEDLDDSAGRLDEMLALYR